MNQVTLAIGAVKQVAELVNRVQDTTNYVSTNSLPDAVKLTRVEPLAVISQDCVSLEYTSDVLQSMLSIFSGYYLQAISILTKINNVEVIKILDKLNPDRDSTALLKMNPSKESYHHVSTESMRYSLPTNRQLSLENTKEVDNLNQASNLSVGKLLNVQIEIPGAETDGKPYTVTVPINVRLLANVIPNTSVEHLMAAKSEDISFIERYYAWRSGRISLIKDLIMCQDLIDEHKKMLLKDDTGIAQEILRRVTNAKKFGLLTKNPSLVSASNMYVITEEVAKNVQDKLRGKLSDPTVRSKLFENTYAMIIAVIDRDYDRVIFYTRNTSSATSLSVREIKQANKNKGPDILDIMKALNSGMNPTF